MEKELVSIFLYQELKEILISRNILTASKEVDFQNLKDVAQKLSLPCPFEFCSLNGRPSVNFQANDFSFWLRA